MRLANKIGARFVLILGEDEMKAGRFSLKRMSDGFQQQMTEAEIVTFLKSERPQ